MHSDHPTPAEPPFALHLAVHSPDQARLAIDLLQQYIAAHAAPPALLEWGILPHVAGLDISARTINVLRDARIEAIDQLCQLSRTQLRDLPRMGPKSFHEIIDALAFHGLSLSEKGIA